MNDKKRIRSDTDAASGIIDVHAHVFPAAYTALVHRLGVPPPVLPGADSGAKLRPPGPAGDAMEAIDGRIALMDEAGVARQILSPTIQPYFNDPSDALDAARLVNDSLAEMSQRRPGRLTAYVSLPLPHVDAALTEMNRGLDELGMAGVTMQCFCQDRSAADPHFEPLYEEMNRRAALLFLHPCVNGLCSPFITQWSLTESAGPPFEDALIAMHLMARSIPHRYPDIRIVIPHLAGGLASQLTRLDNQLPHYADLAEAPSRTARRLWYDTAAHGSAPALRCAIEAFGADRLVPGSDYPILTIHESYRDTFAWIERAGLPAEIVRRILTTNAASLLAPGPP